MRIIFSLLLTLFFLNLFSNQAFSQEKGITVVPSIVHIDLAKDPSEYSLTYINNTKSEINLSLSVQDFTELEEGYRLSFLDPKEASNYKYSLSSWVSFENRNLQLKPGERKSINVFIDKDRITIGGHYASILAEVVQPENEKEVNVKPVLSSLLFVRASTGKEIEDGSVSTFEPLRDAFEYPSVYTLRFENKGNVHVVPYGVLKIYDSSGKEIGKGILNEGSLDALPESIRRYDIKVKNYGKIVFPGFYKANLSMHFGKSNKKLEKEIRFFTYGSFDPLKIGIIVLVLGISLFYLRKKRRS